VSLAIAIADAVTVLGNGALSWGISKFTGPVSHIGLVTAIEPVVQVTQALRDGIKTLTLAETMANVRYGYVLHDTTFEDAARAKMVAWGLKQIGTPYAFGNLALEALDALLNTEKFSIYFDEDGADICSQYFSLAAASIGRSCDITPRKATPSDWFNFSLRSPSWLTQPIPVTA